jgi:hypothetical protein
MGHLVGTTDATAVASAIAAALSAVTATVALIFAWSQSSTARQQSRTAEAQANTEKVVAGYQFITALDGALLQWVDIHENLRPGGAWYCNGEGPRGSPEWLRVEGYMGTFERALYPLAEELLPIDQFDRFYGYRLTNIWANKIIREEKLVIRAEGWKDFIKLSGLLEERGRAIRRPTEDELSEIRKREQSLS